MLKNRIFAILLTLTLMIPVFAEEPVSSKESPIEIQHKSVIPDTEQPSQAPTLMLPENELNPNSYKQPVSKKKIAKKFLLAMGGVGISSIFLFVILTLYNKARNALLEGSKELPPEGETSLVTPDNLTDAVKTFLDKTNWN